MLLEQKLNLVLVEKNLAPIEPIESYTQWDQVNSFKSLGDGIKSIKTIKPNKEGVCVIVAENLDVDELDVPVTLLPIQLGDCVIQGIRKNREGYEIHVVDRSE
jgi:hypothetical protein